MPVDLSYKGMFQFGFSCCLRFAFSLIVVIELGECLCQ